MTKVFDQLTVGELIKKLEYLFDQNQPLGFCNWGTLGGSLLKHIPEFVRQKSRRKKLRSLKVSVYLHTLKEILATKLVLIS